MSSRMRRSLGVWRWRIPGLHVKRWLLLAVVGAGMVAGAVFRSLRAMVVQAAENLELLPARLQRLQRLA